MLHLLYSDKEHRYLLNRPLCGPHSWSRRFGEATISYPCRVLTTLTRIPTSETLHSLHKLHASVTWYHPKWGKLREAPAETADTLADYDASLSSQGSSLCSDPGHCVQVPSTRPDDPLGGVFIAHSPGSCLGRVHAGFRRWNLLTPRKLFILNPPITANILSLQ